MRDLGAVDETGWFFRTVVRRRVGLGFLLGGVFLACAAPTRGSVLGGLWIALAGEGLRTWASGTIVKNDLLATGGPYGFVRNPLYVGSYLLGLGVTLMGRQPWVGLGFAVGFPLIYGPLVRKEEKRMLEKHGDGFLAYAVNVPRFIPNMKARPRSWGPYDPRRMWTVHREWRAWAGLAAVTLYLLLRAA